MSDEALQGLSALEASALDALAGLADTHGLPAKDGAEGAAEPAPKAGKAK